MTPPPPPPGGERDGTHGLPDSARDILIHVAELLRSGYTGEITLFCSEGGVRDVGFSYRKTPTEIRKQKTG